MSLFAMRPVYRISGSRRLRQELACLPAPRLKRPHGRGPGDVIALRKFDSQGGELLEHGFGLDAFGDHFDAHRVTHFADRLHHAFVHLVMRNIVDELAVDLQVVDGQVLEIGKRRQATAEIVQRELATEFLQRPRGEGFALSVH